MRRTLRCENSRTGTSKIQTMTKIQSYLGRAVIAASFGVWATSAFAEEIVTDTVRPAPNVVERIEPGTPDPIATTSIERRERVAPTTTTVERARVVEPEVK